MKQHCDDATELVQIAKASSTQLQLIVEEVLQYSALENGNLTVDRTPFSVAEAAEATLKIVTTTDAASGKSFTTSISPTVPLNVEGDKQKFCQVLSNLLSNAAKFCPTTGGAIKLDVDWDSGKLTVKVTDNGIGIAPSRIASLGQPFSQLDQSNTRRYGGVGLGLAISKRFLEAVGGALSIKSEGEGRGTQASFTFPVVPCVPPPVLRPMPVTTTAATLDTNVSIMLVEDNPVNIKVTLRLLSRFGFSAKVMTEGLAAVEEIRRNEAYDLILMDLHMPGSLDGLEATRVIRSLFTGKARRPKIYALTASIGDEAKRSCYEAGMDGFLSKPLNTELLKQALRDAKPNANLSTAATTAKKGGNNN